MVENLKIDAFMISRIFWTFEKVCILEIVLLKSFDTLIFMRTSRLEFGAKSFHKLNKK